MIELLNTIDKSIFLSLNGFHCEYFDTVMWLISGKWAYILLGVAFLYLSFKKGWKQGAFLVLAVALTVLLADQVASSIIKPLVCRLRPSHNPEFEGLIHLVNGRRAGMYGFVSSHAANSFGVALLVCSLFRNKMVAISMTIWAIAVSYSRIYLGVHYPGDILCGAVVGIVMAWIVSKSILALMNKFAVNVSFTEQDSKILSYAVVSNIAIVMLVGIFYTV